MPCQSSMSIDLEQPLVFVSAAAGRRNSGSTTGPIGHSVQALCFNEVEHLIDLRCLELDEVEPACKADARCHRFESCSTGCNTLAYVLIGSPPARPLAVEGEGPPSGEKYTSLIRLPPMSSAMWEMQSACC